MPEDSVHQGIYICVSCTPLPISGLSASLRLGAKLIKLFSTTKEFPKNLLLSIKKDYRILSSDNIGDWYRYIGVLVPTAMLPGRGLLATLAAPLLSVFFMELRLWRSIINK